MAWNFGSSILGNAEATAKDVEREADVIFTAAFIGLTLFYNQKQQRPWRLDMEPNCDADTTRLVRTEDDRRSMKQLNDICSKVNHIIRSYRTSDAHGMTWGLSPTFDRGGMICAGDAAMSEYTRVKPRYAQTAFVYLTAPQKEPRQDQRQQEMYIGRGAYCGIVIDKEGNAINAMSTIRWSYNEQTPGIGRRWSPPTTSNAFTAQQRGQGAIWGMITPPSQDSVAAATEMQQLGMRFFPKDNHGTPGVEIVGYTHGMIRCVYEIVRLGEGTAFEMSIGTDTFKLSSCLSCSSFMMANGVDASSSHLGRGESWSPYFTHTPESHNFSLGRTEPPLQEAIVKCNAAYSVHMHRCMTEGVEAMVRSRSWVSEEHRRFLDQLRDKLGKEATAENTVARDLYLDAMTFHKGDSKRLQDTLVFDLKTAKPNCDGSYDWYENRPTRGTWETFENPHTDKKIAALHTPPLPLTTKIKIWSVAKDDSCALEFSILGPDGKEALRGKAAQNQGEAFGLIGNLPPALLAASGLGWSIKFAGDREYSPIYATGSIAIGPGDRYSYRLVTG